MTKTRTINASEFKARCLKILDDLDADGIVVTKRGVPIARVSPILAGTNRKLIGSMRGKIKIKGDIFSTRLKWNAQS